MLISGGLREVYECGARAPPPGAGRAGEVVVSEMVGMWKGRGTFKGGRCNLHKHVFFLINWVFFYFSGSTRFTVTIELRKAQMT